MKNQKYKNISSFKLTKEEYKKLLEIQHLYSQKELKQVSIREVFVNLIKDKKL